MLNTFHFEINDALINPNAETPKTVCTMDIQFKAEPNEYLALLQVISQALAIKKEFVTTILPEVMALVTQGADLFFEMQRARVNAHNEFASSR